MSIFKKQIFSKQAAKPRKSRKKGKLSLGTIMLVALLAIILVISFVIYTDPHFLDPVNEFIYGERPPTQADPAVIARWTKTVTFNVGIDESIRQRYQPLPPIVPSAGDTGKANPFIAVTP